MLTCTNKKGKKTYYTGYTNNIPRRLAEHKAGNGARYTRGKDVTLSYVMECTSRKDAMAVERYIKKQSHGWKAMKIINKPITLQFATSLKKQLQSISFSNGNTGNSRGLFRIHKGLGVTGHVNWSVTALINNSAG